MEEKADDPAPVSPVTSAGRRATHAQDDPVARARTCDACPLAPAADRHEHLTGFRVIPKGGRDTPSSPSSVAAGILDHPRPPDDSTPPLYLPESGRRD